MKKVIAILAALVVSISAFSQNYQSAIGLKVGYDVAFTYKTHMSQTNALELGASLSGLYNPERLDLLVNGFYTWEYQLAGINGLSWYVGPGAYLGAHLGKKIEDAPALSASINAMLGLEYKFENIPLALSIDWTPGLNLTGIAFSWHGGGVGAKYTF